MRKYIQNIIKEQFNIANMDFNNKPKRNSNIFNKNSIDPHNVYNRMLKSVYIPDDEMNMLDILVSQVYVPNKVELINIMR